MIYHAIVKFRYGVAVRHILQQYYLVLKSQRDQIWALDRTYTD